MDQSYKFKKSTYFIVRYINSFLLMVNNIDNKIKRGPKSPYNSFKINFQYKQVYGVAPLQGSIDWILLIGKVADYFLK